MITTFFSCIGMMIAGYKKKQIAYIEDIIYMSEYILLMLESTVPDTKQIIYHLQNEERLSKYDFYNLTKASPLNQKLNQKIDNMVSVLGKYDAQTQIRYIQEFTRYFTVQKEQYQRHYDNHSKLYYTLSISTGLLTSLLLI